MVDQQALDALRRGFVLGVVRRDVDRDLLVDPFPLPARQR